MARCTCPIIEQLEDKRVLSATSAVAVGSLPADGGAELVAVAVANYAATSSPHTAIGVDNAPTDASIGATPRPQPMAPQVVPVATLRAGNSANPAEFGRVRVQVPWGRDDASDAGSSAWSRISNSTWTRVTSAGWQQASQADATTPSVGDPDRPIIGGRIYHDDALAPVGLPGGKVVSGLKSNTTPASGANAFATTDPCEIERIRIHAQYEMTTTVEHDDSQSVGVNEAVTIGGAQEVTVGGLRAVTVGGFQSAVLTTDQALSELWLN